MFGRLPPCAVNGINVNFPNMGSYFNPEIPVYSGGKWNRKVEMLTNSSKILPWKSSKSEEHYRNVKVNSFRLGI